MGVVLYLSAQLVCSKWKRRKGRVQMEFCPLSEIIPFCVGITSVFKALETQFKFIICCLNVNWSSLVTGERKEIERTLLFIIFLKCFTVTIDVRLLTWCSALLPLQNPVALFSPLPGEEQHVKQRSRFCKYTPVLAGSFQCPGASHNYLEYLFPCIGFSCTFLSKKTPA